MEEEEEEEEEEMLRHQLSQSMMVSKFDANHDGLDFQEFSEMVQDICEVTMRFTGFETMADLSMTVQ